MNRERWLYALVIGYTIGYAIAHSISEAKRLAEWSAKYRSKLAPQRETMRKKMLASEGVTVLSTPAEIAEAFDGD